MDEFFPAFLADSFFCYLLAWCLLAIGTSVYLDAVGQMAFIVLWTKPCLESNYGTH